MAGNLTAMIAAAFAGGVVSDPYFEYTTLLLPGNGTNGAQNNTFLDSGTANSGSGFPITRNGNTTQGTFSPFSQTGWGNYFNGSSYLTIADNAAFDFGSGNFTLEAWVNIGSSSGTKSIFSKVFDFGPFILLVDGTTVKYYLSSTGSSWNIVNGASGGTVSVGSWSHVALVRNGNIVTPYVNGIAGTTTTTSATLTSNIRALVIGADQTNGSGFVDIFNGYISNARIVKGVAVYSGTSTSTANFTVPTSPLTATQSAGTNIAAITGTETSLLTCQSNRFRDASSNNFAITVNGSPSVQAFSPFNPTSSWSAVTNGGSGYFDGNSDYLSVASNSALQFDGQFTIEAWCYPTTLQTYDCLIITSNSGASANGIGIYLKSNGGILVYNFINLSNIFDTSSGVVLNAWNHIAVTRNSSNGIDLWLNGASQGATQTVSGNFASITPTLIGTTTSASQEFNGYISNVRIVKGTAVYTAAFTPPTAPLTATQSANTNGNPSAAITGSATSLLLNFTNAGIYDATSKNDLETVGDAKISTAISAKWGSGCMAFDGTGDYLTNNNYSNPLLAFGTGDFTIEGWAYLVSGANNGMFQISDTAGGLKASTANNIAVSSSGTNTVTIYINNNVYGPSGSNTLPYNAWTHIAIVRASNVSKLYINGFLQTGIGTSGSITDNTNYTGTYIAVGGYYSTSYLWNGYIQDLRITKGYARYTSNFTPPTSAFPTL